MRSAELGLDTTRNDVFLRSLVKSQVWIMGEGSAMEMGAPTQAQALDHAKRSMEHLSAVESADQIQIYIHTLEGQAILPFFSSADFMQEFVQTLRLDHITCYEGMSVPFTYLLKGEFAKNHFVLNLNSTAQRHVTVDDRKRLMELATQE